MTTSIRMRRPDDWHVHVRDGAVLSAVIGATARVFARAIIMPNLRPPVATSAAAAAYRVRIREALPPGAPFEPLMTLYLTDQTDADDLVAGHRDGVVTAAKLYPQGATTHSDEGVSDWHRIYRVLERMEAAEVPLLLHGEVTSPSVDIFDREARFIETVLEPMVRRLPGLKIVFEHATTREAVDFVRAHAPRLAATITPHHLVINRGDMFAGGIRPHLYCLPVAKRESHRLALVEAAVSGEPCFFLGTDSAPHVRHTKEAACGCAGIFNAPTALQTYTEVFERTPSALPAPWPERLEKFASLNGPAFYGLAPNAGHVTLVREDADVREELATADGPVVVFRGGERLAWSLRDEAAR